MRLVVEAAGGVRAEVVSDQELQAQAKGSKKAGNKTMG